MKLKYLLGMLVCLGSTLNAQEPIFGKILNRYEISDRPSFFFKVSPDGQRIAYTAPITGENILSRGQNKILNLKDGSIREIPGNHDPVFIGDTDLIIINPGAQRAYEIFRFADLEQSIRIPFFSLPNLKGFYQSAGILNKVNNIFKVRIIAERSLSNHSVVDFTYHPKGPTDTGNEVVVSSTQETLLCPLSKIKLPMLSKDGRFLGGLDVETGTTGIWEINEDYSCKKIVDLGIKTGKLNFNFNNSKVTYHLYHKIGMSVSGGPDNYIAHPVSDFVANIFVVDLETLKTIRVTNDNHSNNLYPDFTKEDHLVFVNYPHNIAERVSFIEVE